MTLRGQRPRQELSLLTSILARLLLDLAALPGKLMPLLANTTTAFVSTPESRASRSVKSVNRRLKRPQDQVSIHPSALMVSRKTRSQTLTWEGLRQDPHPLQKVVMSMWHQASTITRRDLAKRLSLSESERSARSVLRLQQDPESTHQSSLIARPNRRCLISTLGHRLLDLAALPGKLMQHQDSTTMVLDSILESRALRSVKSVKLALRQLQDQALTNTLVLII